MRTLSWYEKVRLDEQLKFFGAKKTKFISIYAKKPRILMKERKARFDLCSASGKALIEQEALSEWDMYNRGVQGDSWLTTAAALGGSYV